MDKIALNIKMLNGNNLYYGDFVKTENNLRYQLVRKDGVITYNQFTLGQVQFIVNGLSKKCKKAKRGLSWYCKISMVIDKNGKPAEKKDYIIPKYNPYRNLWQVVSVDRNKCCVKAICENFSYDGKNKLDNIITQYFNSEQFEIVNVAVIESNATEIAKQMKADRDAIRVLSIIEGKCLRVIYKNMEGRVNTSNKYMWLEPSYSLIKNSPLVVDRIYIKEIITK